MKPPVVPRQPIPIKGWVESRLDRFLLRAVLEPLPWWQAIVRWIVTKFAKLTLYFGRTFPYVYRPWYRLAQFVQRRLDQRRHETVKTIFLRRLFSLQRTDGVFRPSYAVCNWLTVLFFLTFVDNLIDGIYAYGTYPFGTYRDVIVTEAYRNITDQSTFAVHGYQMVNGEKHEIYMELVPNIWFMQFYVEFQFGQIPVLGRCTFDTYGISIRIPRRLRMLTAGSLYALNPNIVDMQCVAPDIVPPQSVR